MTDRRECYIPLTPDPEHAARTIGIWQAAGEHLGILPAPGPTEDTET